VFPSLTFCKYKSYKQNNNGLATRKLTAPQFYLENKGRVYVTSHAESIEQTGFSGQAHIKKVVHPWKYKT